MLYAGFSTVNPSTGSGSSTTVTAPTSKFSGLNMEVLSSPTRSFARDASASPLLGAHPPPHQRRAGGTARRHRPPPSTALQRWNPPSSRSISELRRVIKRACLRLGIEPFLPHGIRRSAVDALYRSGADIGAASSILGHSATVALQHYRRSSESDNRAAMQLSRLGYLPEGQVIVLAERA